MSRRPLLSVIGGLSIDTIHLVGELPEPGQMVKAEEFVETGGRAANIAIAANRFCHPKPRTDDGLLPDTPHESGISSYFRSQDGYDETSTPEVRVIAAVAPDMRQKFYTVFRRNGVNIDGLAEFNSSQSRFMSIFQKDTKRARQTIVPGVERYWTPGSFDTPEKLGAGRIPNLVVVTMELNMRVVEQIINTAHSASIDVIIYGSPGDSLLSHYYPMVKHIIVDEGDAGIMLGHKRGYVNIDRWQEICEEFVDDKLVPNIVLKVGPHGAYYKNATEEGYASGYTPKNGVTDTTGSTAAFVGAYAADYLRKTFAGDPWSIHDSTVVGNKVSAFCVADIGCINATPWAGALADFEDQPLYSDLEGLKEGEGLGR